MAVWDVVSAQPTFSNVLSDMPPDSVLKVGYRINMARSGRRRILQPEQKRVTLMNNLLVKPS